METEQNQLRIVAIFAHPDDEHIPFGLPAQLASEGHEVFLIALTKGDLGSHTFSSRRSIAQVRKNEFTESARLLGAKEATILGFSDGALHHQVKKAEKKLLKKLRQLKPDVVLLPGHNDYHQDHVAAHEIGKWALFHMPDSALITRHGILRRKIQPVRDAISVYETDTQGSQTWQSITEDNGEIMTNLNKVNTIIPISPGAIRKSVVAFYAHQSQLNPRPDGKINYPELARRGANRKGKQINSSYGVGLNFIPFGGYAFSTKNLLTQI